jgi:hypothetical protein
MPNKDFFHNFQNYDAAGEHVASSKQTITRHIENPAGRNDGMHYSDDYNKAESKEKISSHALQNDRFLGDNGGQYDHTIRKGRSSYESRSRVFHRGREGVRNDDRIMYRRNGCSGRRYENGERRIEGEENCEDKVSSPDFDNFGRESLSTISPNPLHKLHDTYNRQVEKYSLGDSWEAMPPQKAQFEAVSSDRETKSGSQRNGRNENYRTDIVRYGDTESSQPVETKDRFEGLEHDGMSSYNGDVLRNGRQTTEGSKETREGEVYQAVEPNAVAEPRQGDAVTSYYDFLINEGSYKFWAVFQVVTACLLIYSAFAAIYYAKYTFSMMDYPDYLDEGFFFKRSGEAYVTTTTAKPSSYSFLGLSPQTFQRIMNALSSKKYS